MPRQDYTVKRPLSEFEPELDGRTSAAWGGALIVNLRQHAPGDPHRGRARRTGRPLPLPRGAYEPLNRAIIAHT